MSDEEPGPWVAMVPERDYPPYNPEEYDHVFASTTDQYLAVTVEFEGRHAGAISALYGGRVRPRYFRMREWRRQPPDLDVLARPGRIDSTGPRAFEVEFSGLLVPDGDGHFYRMKRHPLPKLPPEEKRP